MISIHDDRADRTDRSRMPRPARPAGAVPLERYYPMGARRSTPPDHQRPARAPLFAAIGTAPVRSTARIPQPAVAPSSRRFLPAF